MTTKLICPRCGESKKVELVPFLDEDGRPKVQLTCRLIVHEEPVVVEYDDPSVPKASDLTPADGLVHDLDLYDKLEGIVMKLERPVEYGIVEHLFAHAYPDEYVTLWRRYGHVDTHGSIRYSVSAYLSRLLGNLWRHGSVVYMPAQGTGRWSYNADISAWANPARADGPIQSWVEFSQDGGWSAASWPATALLPADEIPDVPLPPDGGFWVYDNNVHRYARIHRADCSYCNDGAGFHPGSGDDAGGWLGPFADMHGARVAAQGPSTRSASARRAPRHDLPQQRSAATAKAHALDSVRISSTVRAVASRTAGVETR